MVSQLRRKLAERVRGNAALWHKRRLLSPQFVPLGPRQGAVACRPRARRVTSQRRTRQGGMDKSRGHGGHHISSCTTSSRTLIREPAALKIAGSNHFGELEEAGSRGKPGMTNENG